MIGPLLTLAFPAHNDFASSLNSLKSIARDQDLSDVELILSDNASEDDLHLHVQRFAEIELPQLTVFRQPTNLGFAGNLKFLAERSSGRWIWFIGVGETITPGSLKTIVNILRDYEPDHLFVNAHNSENQDCAEVRFTEGGQFHEAISLNVFTRKDVLSAELVKGDKSDNWWPHLKVFIETFERSGTRLGSTSGTGVVSIAPNYSGWWYHMPSAMEIYFEKLRLISAGILGGRIHNPQARAYLMSEETRLQGVQFALTLAENRRQGLQPLTRKVMVESKLLGVQLAPRVLGVLLSAAPAHAIVAAGILRKLVLSLRHRRT